MSGFTSLPGDALAISETQRSHSSIIRGQDGGRGASVGSNARWRTTPRTQKTAGRRLDMSRYRDLTGNSPFWLVWPVFSSYVELSCLAAAASLEWQLELGIKCRWFRFPFSVLNTLNNVVCVYSVYLKQRKLEASVCSRRRLSGTQWQTLRSLALA